MKHRATLIISMLTVNLRVEVRTDAIFLILFVLTVPYTELSQSNSFSSVPRSCFLFSACKDSIIDRVHQGETPMEIRKELLAKILSANERTINFLMEPSVYLKLEMNSLQKS